MQGTPAPTPAHAGITLTRKAERYIHQLETSPARSLSPRAARAIATLRRGVQDEIDRLIGILDRIDGDPDLEPSLGSDEARSHHYQPRWAGGGREDREEECDYEEEPSGFGDLEGLREWQDGEPSLGATENFSHLYAWPQDRHAGYGAEMESIGCEPYAGDGEEPLAPTPAEEATGRSRPATNVALAKERRAAKERALARSSKLPPELFGPSRDPVYGALQRAGVAFTPSSFGVFPYGFHNVGAPMKVVSL
jgi:hypothetical protein